MQLAHTFEATDFIVSTTKQGGQSGRERGFRRSRRAVVLNVGQRRMVQTEDQWGQLQLHGQARVLVGSQSHADADQIAGDDFRVHLACLAVGVTVPRRGARGGREVVRAAGWTARALLLENHPQSRDVSRGLAVSFSGHLQGIKEWSSLLRVLEVCFRFT